MRVAFGIDVGGASPIVMRAERQRGRIRLHDATLEDAQAAAPEALLGRIGVAGALPAGDAVLRRLSAPITSIGKARRVFPALLEGGLPFPLEQCVVCVDELDFDRDGGISGLGMAALRERVQARLQAFESEEIHLTRMEHEALVLWRRSLEEMAPESEVEARLVACVTSTRLTMAMGRGRRIEASYGGLLRAGMESPAGARRALRGWCGAGEFPVRVLWAGVAADDPRVRRPLEEEWSACAAMRHDTHANHASLLARGLATEALRHPAEGVFLSGDFESAPVRRAREQPLRWAAIFACAAGLLLTGGAELWRRRMSRAEDLFRAGLNERALRVTGRTAIPLGLEAERAREYADARRAEIAPLLAFLQPANSPVSRSRITAAARIMDAARERDARIERLDLRENELRIEGRAMDWDHPEQMARGLAGAGYPKPGVQRGEADKEGRVPYLLEGRLE